MKMKRLLPFALLALGAAAAVSSWPASAPAPAVADASSIRSIDSTSSTPSAPSTPPAAATAPTATSTATEEQLTASLRALVDERPEEALAVAAEAAKAFPAGRLADERSFLAMRALVHLDRIGAAREAAADFHRRFPDSRWAEQVVRLTGYQPRRYGPKR